MTAALLVLPTIVAAAMLMGARDGDLDWRHVFVVGAVSLVCAAIVFAVHS